MGAFWSRITGDSQLRWVGPEKGVIHLATAAVVNAVWDLYAKSEGKPLWKLLVDMSPEEIVSCIDFRYTTDAITSEEALDILRENEPTKAAREEEMLRDGFPAYTTSTGWLGYDDEKLRRLCREAVRAGWTHRKMKVGTNTEDDVRRAALIREEIGPKRKLMMDANQVWDVDEPIENMQRLKEFDPWWIEEPTSPDDVLGHARIARAVAPVGVDTHHPPARGYSERQSLLCSSAQAGERQRSLYPSYPTGKLVLQPVSQGNLRRQRGGTFGGPVGWEREQPATGLDKKRTSPRADPLLLEAGGEQNRLLGGSSLATFGT